MHKHTWRKANMGLIPSGIFMVFGGIICSVFGHVQTGSLNQRLIAIGGLLIFMFFSTIFLHVLTGTVYKILISSHLGTSRAVAIRFMIRVFGYIVILFTILGLLHIPFGRLLIGGAAIGIILGVAAQQALANFFASVVLIISHPYSVGEKIILNSGALGGSYEGKVIDIGLTHTLIEEENGNIVHLPNATLLSNTAIRSLKQK